jgi:hypothetical protein
MLTRYLPTYKKVVQGEHTTPVREATKECANMCSAVKWKLHPKLTIINDTENAL